MNRNLVDFTAWMEVHCGDVMQVSKLKSINARSSGISEGESFVGLAQLQYVGDEKLILFMQYPYMHTSVLIDAQQKNEETWLVKTQNSIYKVKLRG